jgi:hypothetical protein
MKIATQVVIAAADRATNPDLERFMAQRGRASVELKLSHVACISQPTAVAKLIEQGAAHSDTHA